MYDVQIVQGVQPIHHLDERLPDISLVEHLAALCDIHDFFMKVAPVDVLHDNVERLGLFI